MKISEMIKELQESMKWNGDQELVVMVYGKRFTDIELYADENELYLEAYIPDKNEEDLFLRQHVLHHEEWK